MTNWTDLYTTWQLPLQKLAFRYVKDVQLAEDIVQDIFQHMLEKKTAPTFMDHAEAYLKTAVYHKCISYLRKKTMQRSMEEWIYTSAPSNFTEQQVLYRELHNLHFKALNALPVKQKQVYLLSHLEGYDRNELSFLLGSSSNTVKNQLQLSRQSVRAVLTSMRA